jgi:1-acyl-sn-glycerol-3-phosphate acyltransferase
VLSIHFAFWIFFTLAFFHPIQWFALKVLGTKYHEHTLNALNWCFCRCLLLIGTTLHFEFDFDLNELDDEPAIIVSNHQSMFDISPIAWKFRKIDMTYISKIELAKGIPSISYNLKHGYAVAIDRKKPLEADRTIRELAQVLKREKKSVLMFPEGTRSRDGQPKKFKKKGLSALLEEIPNATVIPISLNNSWKIFMYGSFPFRLGTPLSFFVHKPMKAKDYSNLDEFIDDIEVVVKSKVKL